MTYEHRWVAGPDGVGHAIPTRGKPYRRCDHRAFSEQFTGYPVRVKCPRCLLAVEGAPIGG